MATKITKAKASLAMREYDLIADWYARDRHPANGRPELETFMASLPPHAAVLDVGCGNGIPITRALLDAGCSVLGVDSSPRMLDRFQQNCPGTPFLCRPIQDCELEVEAFDGVIAWGVLFHMEHAEQRKAIATVASALKPGGVWLFTAGDEHGSIQGEPMNGVPFRYWSFSVDGYRELLQENGLTLVDMHRDKGQNIYYLARKGGDAE
jgi:SAM-dependent methyltransferase